MATIHDWNRADEAYRFGRCAELAYRLSQKLSLPMAALVDGTRTTYHCGHAFVVDGNHAIDIRGRRSLAAMRGEWRPELGSKMRLIMLNDGQAFELVREWRNLPADAARDKRWIDHLIACNFAPPHVNEQHKTHLAHAA